jgi:orotidine-5'-phosphate decarboxylase
MSKLILRPEERLILALDFPELKEAKTWVNRFRGKVKTFKVGPILFLNAGPSGFKDILDYGADVFLDLKFHDIPSTVEKAARQVVGYGVKMFTIHALGGFEMMKRTLEGVKEESERLNLRRPSVLAVTVLTSQTDDNLNQVGISSSTIDEVLRLADLADKSGVDGLVASGNEVEILRKEFGNRFTMVVPGVRLDKKSQDQKRVITPREALAKGADYIVLGRAITESQTPESVLDEIIRSISYTNSV